MKYLFIFLTLITPSCIFSQIEQKQGLLIDLQSREPIEFASICSKNERLNCVSSGQNGTFTLTISKGDSIIITRIGYADTIFSSSILISNSVLQLRRIEKILNEVVVSICRFDKEMENGKNKKKNVALSIIPGLEFGKVFESKKNPFKLNSIYFFAASQPAVSHAFLLSVYQFDAIKKQTENLIFSKIIKIETEGKLVNEIQIPIDENPIFSKHYLVSLKYIGSNNPMQKLEILATTKEKEAKTYERYFNNKWIYYPNYFFLQSSEKMIPNIIMITQENF